MIIQEISEKTTKTKVFNVSKSFSTIEVDPKSNRIMFIKENKTVGIIFMSKSCRYTISEEN